jgi:quercetin 2,3-dioxygenase
VGATVKRVIGTRVLRTRDPFLMLDYFNVKLPGGFPDHPHRGFETVTYMLKGKILHEDFKGHKGEIGPGDIQWMTAGKGIVHAEMPASKTESSIGFQLWINLQSKLKFIEPMYQEYTSAQIPIYKEDGLLVKLIAGEAYGVNNPLKT